MVMGTEVSESVAVFEVEHGLTDRRDALSAVTGWKPVFLSYSAKRIVVGEHAHYGSMRGEPVRAGAVFDFDGHAVRQRQGGGHGG